MPKEHEETETTIVKMTITTWTTIVDGVAYFFMRCPICGASNGIPLSDVIQIIQEHQRKEESISKKVTYIQ